MSDAQLINGDAMILGGTANAFMSDNLYPLDQTEYTVPIQVKSGAICNHRLKKPTLQQLIEREAAIVCEREEVAPGEHKFTIDDESANAALWGKIAIWIQGYSTSGYTSDQEIPVTPEIAAKIPDSHKANVIRGSYRLDCVLVEQEDDGFNLDAETYVIKQEIGGETPDYVIHHTLRRPTEGERKEYHRRASQTLHIQGSRRAKARITSNLKAVVELYDRLFIAIDGISGIAEPLKQIDAVWKRSAMQALMGVYESNLGNSQTG